MLFADISVLDRKFISVMIQNQHPALQEIAPQRDRTIHLHNLISDLSSVVHSI